MISFEVDAEEAIAELDRLAKGPELGGMEGALASGYMTTSQRVHVLTGRLKESGHPISSFSDGTWEGIISYARHPGIFELARGDSPTMNHPEGGHFFFDPGGEEFLAGVKKAIMDYVSGGE